MAELEAGKISKEWFIPPVQHGIVPSDWQLGLVSAILVNWNGERYIAQCLESLKEQTWPLLEIILVDNASTDRSMELVESFDKLDIRILRNRENLGFAGANNQGIRAAKGEYVLFLNLDVELDASYVEQLVTVLREDSRLGSAMGKLYQLRDGSRTEFIDSAGIWMLRSRQCLDRGQGEQDMGLFEHAERIFGACAAAALYRRETLEALAFEGEYFDNAFHMYKEDVDLAWRSLVCGWECLLVPSAIGWHERRGSSGHLQRHIDVHSFKNRYLMMVKNDRLPDILRDVVPITIFNVIDLVKIIRWPYLAAAIPQTLRLLPRVLRWRRETQSCRRAGPGVPRIYFASSRGTIRRRWMAWRNSWR